MAYASADYAGVLATIGQAPGTTEGWLLRIRALANVGDIERAKSDADTALARDGLCVDLWVARAVVQMAVGQLDDAYGDVARAVYLRPNDAGAHLLRAHVLWRLGRMSQASAGFRLCGELLSSLPADADVPPFEGENAGQLLRSIADQVIEGKRGHGQRS